MTRRKNELIANVNFAFVGLLETGDTTQQRGLAAPGGSQKCEEGPRFNGQTHVVDRGNLAKPFGQIFDDNICRFHNLLSLTSKTFFETAALEAGDDKVADQDQTDQDDDHSVCQLGISILVVTNGLAGQNLGGGCHQ